MKTRLPIAEMRRIAEVRKEARLAQGLPATKSFLEKFQEKPTRQNAINLHCEWCMGGKSNPGVTALIRDCTSGPRSSWHCPFYEFRPYK